LLLVELFHLMQPIFIIPLQPMEHLLLQASHLLAILWLLQVVVVEVIAHPNLQAAVAGLVVLDI
jgi:hypothetical protein